MAFVIVNHQPQYKCLTLPYLLVKEVMTTIPQNVLKEYVRGGRTIKMAGVKSRGHLSPHKYIKDALHTEKSYRRSLGKRRKKQNKTKLRKPQRIQDKTCALGKKLWRSKSFCTLKKPPQLGQWCHLTQPQEENAAIGVWKTKCRKLCTEIRADPALPSLGHVSACSPEQVGTGCWDPGFEVRPPGEV